MGAKCRWGDKLRVATLRSRRVLQRFVCVEFGYEDLDEMLARLRPAGGELVGSGGGDYALALAPLPARARVLVDQFAGYDANIVADSGRLRMTGADGRTWKPHQYLALLAAIARIQRNTPAFIGVSVRTRRVRPRLHPRATAAHRRGPLSPGGVRAGRVTPEQNARHCDTSPQAERLRLVETLFVRPCVSPQGDAHGRKQLPHVTVDVLHDGGFYREIDGPAGLVESAHGPRL